MANSKSTSTPVESSSSNTNAHDHTGGRRSSRSNAGTRSTPAQSSPSKRKAGDHIGSSRTSKRRAVAAIHNSNPSNNSTPTRSTSSRWKWKDKEVAPSDEQLFRQRHPSIFGDGPVKVEEPDEDNISACPQSTVESEHDEKVLESILVGKFGSEARQHAVDQLLQAARQSAASGADFGVTYVEATVNRLKRRDIEESRLAEIVGMFQQGLWEPLSEFRARVEFLGRSLQSHLSLPPGTGSNTTTESSGLKRSLELRPSHRVVVAVAPNGKKSARSESSHPPSSTSDSSSDDDDTVTLGSQRNSRYLDNDDEEYVDGSNRAARRSEYAEHENAPVSRPANNFRLYGTLRSNGKAFDTYARSAISACMPAPGDDATGVKIRKQARLLWRLVSGKDKEDWEALHAVRYSDTDVYNKGHTLLETQGILAILRVKCRDIINTTDAGPSRPAPALPQLAATLSLSSEATTASTRTILGQPSSLPAPALPEPASTASLSSGATASTRTILDQPSFIAAPLPKPTAMAHVTSKDSISTKGKHLTASEVQKACSHFGLSQVQRCNKNIFTVSFPNNAEVDMAEHTMSITLPSTGGSPVDVKAELHRHFPPRTFFCDATELAIEHSVVSSRVLKALHSTLAGPQVAFDLLQQETPDPHDGRRHYLVRFKYDFRPPCNPWAQCFYIPLDHESGDGSKVWGVFTPEDFRIACSFCGKHCQRGQTSSCPFAKVIGSQ